MNKWLDFIGAVSEVIAFYLIMIMVTLSVTGILFVFGLVIPNCREWPFWLIPYSLASLHIMVMIFGTWWFFAWIDRNIKKRGDGK